MNKNRYEELAAQVGAISVEIAKVTSKLGTALPDQLEPLVDKLGKLEDRKRDCLATLTTMREAERQERSTQGSRRGRLLLAKEVLVH